MRIGSDSISTEGTGVMELNPILYAVAVEHMAAVQPDGFLVVELVEADRANVLAVSVMKRFSQSRYCFRVVVRRVNY